MTAPSEPSGARGWVRLYPTSRIVTNPRLRQGVWYPIVDPDLGERLVIQVLGRSVAVPKRLVEIRPKRPTRFTVVYLARNQPNPAEGTARFLGRKYAVCPVCGARVRVAGEPERLQCTACGHQGEVAWWETG
ncbi:MAG: hypothetical protein A3K13_08605 [Gemmatimonadetes bacterium RIFCSPLOWO2_12_FULL_68_9]|nr:MAG: hypothetical protein A3K13_08605 [Gemmatimonadetes bacterium RIFCSPLOWO2_12_FULL_68_9]